MIARSFSSLALILLLVASTSFAAQIGSNHASPHIDTASRARAPRPKKPKSKSKISKKRTKTTTGPGSVFIAISTSHVKAVWGATTVLRRSKPSCTLNSPAGWNEIETDILAAGGTLAGPKGGKSDRARCHMIGDALGGKGKKSNLFTCFAYFNNQGMFHFERQLQAEIKSLRGADKCEMTVTIPMK